MIVRTLMRKMVAVAGLALPFLVAPDDSMAYRVKKVCEEVATKHGPMQKCRSVLDTSEPEVKVPEKKAEVKKPSGGH